MKSNKLKKLILIFLSVFVVTLSVGLAAGFYYFQQFSFQETHVDYDVVSSNTDGLLRDKRYISAAVLGTDASGLRTDSMMVVVFDKKTGALNLFSIPRDSRIEVSDELKAQFSEPVKIPQFIKLTELHAYMKRYKAESPASITKRAIEQITGLAINHTILLDTSGFKKLVDAVGGVEVNVPRDLDYEDPYQDLYIHLKKGTQVLSGDQAEQFVRFRQSNSGKGYGDFGRMEMQQLFLKSFIDTLKQPQNLTRIDDIIGAMSDFAMTDASFVDVLSYTKYLGDIDLSRVQSHQLPGEAAVINGGWYFVLEPEVEMHAFVHQALLLSQQKPISSVDKVIFVKNGAGINGVAQATADLLTALGYTIDGIGTYEGPKTMKTIIVVREPGFGLDLLGHFQLARIEVDPSMLEDHQDILIVVGGADAN